VGGVPEPEGAAFGGAGLGGVVDADEAEACRVAVGPLEVVEEGPGEVAADVGPAGAGLGDGRQMGGEVGGAVGVVDEAVGVGTVVVGGAVLGAVRSWGITSQPRPVTGRPPCGRLRVTGRPWASAMAPCPSVPDVRIER
jgi:hypothetical protein